MNLKNRREDLSPKGAIAHGEITRRNLAKLAVHHYRFMRKRTESDCAITSVTKKLLEFATDKPQKQILALCQTIVADFLPKVLVPNVEQKVIEHKGLGHATWLITASPIELAKYVAIELNMTGAIGTTGEIVKGRYSGQLPDGAMHGIRKADSVRELSLKRGYDLESSFAYSDSINDLPLLLTVGNPRIVNPNKELEILAAKNSWPIVA